MTKLLNGVVKTSQEGKYNRKNSLKYIIPAAIFSIGALFSGCDLKPKEEDLVPYLTSNASTVNRTDALDFNFKEKNDSVYTKDYQLEFDYNNDNIIDERVNSPYELNVQKAFNYEGIAKVYGTLTSTSGKKYKTSLEILVLPKDAPIATLICDKEDLRKGELAKFNLDATDPNNNIIQYELNFDDGADGIGIEQIKGNSPIELSKRAYSSRLRVSGKVTDSTGLESEVLWESNLLEDLTSTWEFRDKYNPGDPFNYIWKITNINPNKVIIDNTISSKINYSFKNITTNKEEFGFNLDGQKLLIHFKQNSSLTIDSIKFADENKTEFTLSKNASAQWQGIPFWINGLFSLTWPLGSSTIPAPGDYIVEANIDYEVEGQGKYSVTLRSPQIKVE